MSDAVYESVVHPNMLLALSALPDCGARDQVMKLVAEQADHIRELEADAERFRWIEAQGMWALNEALERYPHGPISMAIDEARKAQDRSGEHE